MDARMNDGSVVEIGSRAYYDSLSRGRHPGTVHLMGLFAWSHLPENLQMVTRFSGMLAVEMVTTLSDGPELTTGLRKLLEAKDCFVRAALESAE